LNQGLKYCSILIFMPDPNIADMTGYDQDNTHVNSMIVEMVEIADYDTKNL